MYLSKEPPRKYQDILYKNNIKFSTLFHITYTYRTDSVIPFVYGKVVPKNLGEDEHVALQKAPLGDWKSLPNKIPSNILNRDLSYKTKDILWMVSHCTSDSRRENYVKKLQTELSTLSIDILGKCGKDELPKSSIVGNSIGSTRISISNINFPETLKGIMQQIHYLQEVISELSIYFFFQINTFIDVSRCTKNC